MTRSIEVDEIDNEDRQVVNLEHLKVLNLEPDDVLVVTSPTVLSDQSAAEMATELRSAFGEERRILLLDSGLELGVVRRTSEDT